MGLRANRKGLRRWAAAALLPLAAAACDSPTEMPQTRTTTLNVYLKDQAGDVDSVWIQIDDVILKGDSSQVSVLDQPTGLINVTALQDSVMALATGVDLTETQFNEVRIMLGGAVLKSGDAVWAFGNPTLPAGLSQTGTLKCPSCSQSGLKLKLADTLQFAEGDNGLLMDFDVSQSFGHEAGNSGMWVMHPVIHGVQAEPVQIEDGTALQKITGAVTLANTVTMPISCDGADRTLALFAPVATATTLVDGGGNPLVFTGMTALPAGGSTWMYEIDVTGPDVFTMGYEGETSFTAQKLVWTAAPDSATVTLTGSADGTTDYVITSVACEDIP